MKALLQNLVLLVTPLVLADEGPTLVYSPSPATPDDVIEVRVRTDEDGGFLHWGVNGLGGDWVLPAEVYWPVGSKPGASGVAVDSPLPPATNGWATLRLGPFNHPAQAVVSLNAALRWGTRWDSLDGTNYNLRVLPHADAPALAWTDAGEELSGSRLTLRVDSWPPAERVELFRAGERIATADGPRLAVELDTVAWPDGPQALTARGFRSGHLGTSTRTFWKLPRLQAGSVPADLPFGAQQGEDEWTVHLHAPNARFVELEWGTDNTSSTRELMRPTPQGGWIARVRPDRGPWRYRYWVDGFRAYADPYSLDVDWRGADGEESAFPAQAWTVVGTQPAPAADGFVRPPLETWVIYELNLSDIAPPGSFTGLVEKLEGIAWLGVNAIEPLPVTEFPGDTGWGYNPAFHFAPETAYGSPTELSDLVREAHRHGLAFVFDIVLNHLAASSPLNQLHGPPEVNPYFRVFQGFNWGFPDLDQESPDFKRYVRDVLRHWVLAYGIDGYRYDATQWIGWSGEDWGVGWFAKVVEEADPGVVQIAENLPGEPAMVKGTALDSEWDAHFRWRIRKILQEAELTEPEKVREVLDPRSHAYASGWERMAYIESHDEERFVRELLEHGFPLPEALRRSQAAAAVCLTVPGIPMLYAGQEWGEVSKKVVGPNPLNPALALEPERAAMRNAFRTLIHLRVSHPALHHDRIGILHLDPEQGTLAYLRPGESESVLVTLNVSLLPARIVFDPPFEGWSEVIPGTALPDGHLRSVLLQPGEARVFRVGVP